MSHEAPITPAIHLLLDRLDLEELEHALRLGRGSDLRVVRVPPLDPEEIAARPRHITIPTDFASRPVALPGQVCSWLTLVHPVDLDALVEQAFSAELAEGLAPEELEEDRDDDIPVDIELPETRVALSDGQPKVVGETEPAAAETNSGEAATGDAVPIEAAVLDSSLALRIQFGAPDGPVPAHEPESPVAGAPKKHATPPPLPAIPPPIPGAHRAATPPPLPGSAHSPPVTEATPGTEEPRTLGAAQVGAVVVEAAAPEHPLAASEEDRLGARVEVEAAEVEPPGAGASNEALSAPEADGTQGVAAVEAGEPVTEMVVDSLAQEASGVHLGEPASESADAGQPAQTTLEEEPVAFAVVGSSDASTEPAPEGVEPATSSRRTLEMEPVVAQEAPVSPEATAARATIQGAQPGTPAEAVDGEPAPSSDVPASDASIEPADVSPSGTPAPLPVSQERTAADAGNPDGGASGGAVSTLAGESEEMEEADLDAMALVEDSEPELAAGSETAPRAALDGRGVPADQPKEAHFDPDRTPPPIPLDAATPLGPRLARPAPPGPPQVAAHGEIGTSSRPSAESSPPAIPAAARAHPKPPEIPQVAKAAEPIPPPPPSVSREAPRSKKKFRKAWYEEFFDDDYLRTLPFMTRTVCVKEAAYIMSRLELGPGNRVLDIGCGYGRHAIELAASKISVTGIDTSLPLMIKAAELSRDQGVEVDFMHQDMREMTFDSEFDGAYCMMTSFGYFDDEANQDVIRRVFRALKPGGRFLLEVINRDFVLGDLPSRVWWEGDECVVMDEVEFNFLTSRIVSKRSVVFADGRSVNHDLSIRAYCLHELGRLLSDAGFKVSSVTGSMSTQDRFFGQYSPYLIILAQKKS